MVLSSERWRSIEIQRCFAEASRKQALKKIKRNIPNTLRPDIRHALSPKQAEVYCYIFMKGEQGASVMELANLFYFEELLDLEADAVNRIGFALYTPQVLTNRIRTLASTINKKLRPADHIQCHTIPYIHFTIESC